MYELNEVHNISLLPLEKENYETAFKNFVLFSIIEDKEVIIVNKNNFVDAFDYISKHNFEEEIVCLDENSYDLFIIST
jgi:hypothetical protein